MKESVQELKATRRIAVIGLSYPYRGGISHFSTLFVRELRRRYDVLFISFIRQYPDFLFPGTSQFDQSAKSMSEPNERLIDSLNPLSWFRTARRINKTWPDLIVIQWWHPFFGPIFGTIVRLLKPALRERVCFLCHNVLPHEGNPLQTLFARYAFANSPYFVVHSQQDFDQLQAIRPEKTIRLGCHPTYAEFGADEELGKEAARKKLGIEGEERVILYFGLVRKYKGLKYLIKALPKINAELPCKLVIAGEFYDDKAPYTDLIRSEGVGDSVLLVDKYIPNEDVASYFRSADVAVLPYVSATQSGIVQIAFGLGTPVITTNVGGLPEAVDDEVTGLIVDAEDEDQLATAILRYYSEGLEEKFRRAILGQSKRFEWQEEIKHIDEFIEHGSAATIAT